MQFYQIYAEMMRFLIVFHILTKIGQGYSNNINQRMPEIKGLSFHPDGSVYIQPDPN